MAVALREPEADRCIAALTDTAGLLIAAPTAAKEHGCPLLYVGNDFAKTDIEAAIR